MNQQQADEFGRLLDGVARGSLELFHRLSPAGREYFRHMVEPMLRGSGDQTAMEALYAVDYERIPPDPKTFLTHPDYAAHVGKELWAPWVPYFLKVCDSSSAIYEVIATGAMGLGKTSWAMLVLAYKLARLGHLRDPAMFYGLPHKAKIVFGLYAITKNLVKQVGFYDLRDIIIDQSPFFRDVMPRLPHGKEMIRWPAKNIEVVTGSTELHAIGQNLFAVVADELNYYAQGEKTAERANDLVAEVSRRLESRFVGYGGEIPGIAIFISQTRTTTDFLEMRIRDKKDAPGTLVIRGPRWAFCPKGYERVAEQVKADASNAGPHAAVTPLGPVPAFRVYLGDEVHDGRVLDTVVKRDDGTYLVQPINPDQEPEGRILHVPVIHYRAFIDDMHGALRALADEPTGTFTPFFPRREVIEACFDESLIFPFSSQQIPCYEGQVGKLADAFDHELVTRIHLGARVPLRHPEAPRYIHLDLSQGGDRTGFAMVHPSAHYTAVRTAEAMEDARGVGEAELVKEVEVDFYLALTCGPSGEPIDYRRVRVFIETLRRMGYWIKWATADQYMCVSGDTRVLTHRGLVPMAEVEVGDHVQTRRGVRPVTEKFDLGDKATYKLTTRDGDVLEATEEHQIEVLDGWDYAVEQRARRDEGFSHRVPRWKWAKIRDVHVGSVVRMWNYTHLSQEDWIDGVYGAPLTSAPLHTYLEKGAAKKSPIDAWLPPDTMTPELAEWLGLVWGDGHFTGEGREDGVGLTVGGDDEVSDALDCFERLFDVPFDARTDDKGVYRITASSRGLVRWMRENGLVKPLVPEAILRSGRCVQAAFLRGLFAADGNVNRNDGTVGLVTIHRDLAQQVRLMLRSGFGFDSRLVRAECRDYGTDRKNGRDAWHVRLRGSRRAFAEFVDFTYRRKHAELMCHEHRPGRQILARVVSIEPGLAHVYDIAVEGEPSYVANGFVSHNSFDHLMRLRDTGVNAEVVSCDKTSRAYRDLRQCANEGRLALPFPPGADPGKAGSRSEALTRVIVFNELTGLEHDVKKDRVDHRAVNPDGTKGSKDVGDGLAGATHKCLTDETPVGPSPEKRTFQKRTQDKYNRYMERFRHR
jgi:hypothetical protein